MDEYLWQLLVAEKMTCKKEMLCDQPMLLPPASSRAGRPRNVAARSFSRAMSQWLLQAVALICAPSIAGSQFLHSCSSRLFTRKDAQMCGRVLATLVFTKSGSSIRTC